MRSIPRRTLGSLRFERLFWRVWLASAVLSGCGSSEVAGPARDVRKIVFVRDSQIFSSGTGDYFSPSWSSSGREVVFLRRIYLNGPGNNPQIFLSVVDANGEVQADLLQAPISSTSRRSPDGIKLVFLTTLDQGSSQQQVQVMNTQSGEVTVVPPEGTERFFSPSWGPESAHFYVSQLVGFQWDVYECEVGGDGSGVPVASHPSANEIYASMSPDGRWLAYFSDVESQTRLHVQQMDTGEVRKLSDLARTAKDVAWSPDSSRLAFVGSSQIHTIQPDGGGTLQLTTLPAGYLLHAWSPRGQSLTYRANLVPSSAGLDVNELYIIDSAGGQPELLLNDALDLDIFWAP